LYTIIRSGDEARSMSIEASLAESDRDINCRALIGHMALHALLER
jgi:hypothetical protein